MADAVVVAKTFCVDPIWGRLANGVDGVRPDGRLHWYRGTTWPTHPPEGGGRRVRLHVCVAWHVAVVTPMGVHRQRACKQSDGRGS